MTPSTVVTSSFSSAPPCWLPLLLLLPFLLLVFSLKVFINFLENRNKLVAEVIPEKHCASQGWQQPIDQPTSSNDQPISWIKQPTSLNDQQTVKIDELINGKIRNGTLNGVERLNYEDEVYVKVTHEDEEERLKTLKEISDDWNQTTTTATIDESTRHMLADVSRASTRGDLKTIKRLFDDHDESPTSRRRDHLLNIVDESCGRTALHWASRYGQQPVLEWLVDSGADFDLRDGEGLTALHHAAFYGHGHVAEKLIEVGADVNRRDRRGKTPLYVAAENSQDVVGVSLLKAGAETESRPWRKGGGGGDDAEGEVGEGGCREERNVEAVLDVVCREGLVGCARIIVAKMENFYEKELLTQPEQLRFECESINFHSLMLC